MGKEIETIGDLAQHMATSIQRSTRQTAPAAQPIPEWAKAIRDAARLPELASHQNFVSVQDQCVRSLAQQLGERYSPTRASLDKFEVYDQDRQGKAVHRVKDFIDSMAAMLTETRGLVLYGSVGTGKDHLLAAALYRVASAGVPTSWVSGEDIYLMIRDSMDTHKQEEAILSNFIRPTVLGLSDPIGPRGNLSEWNASVLVRVLDRRYRALRPTWLTMNADSEDDAKMKLGPVIWDRFRDSAEIIPCFWSSNRPRKNA